MAPRTEHHATRRGALSERARRNRRNAYTGAGVNSTRPSAARDRGFGNTHWPQYGEGERQTRARNLVPPGGRLVDRMTVDDDQRRHTRAQDVRDPPPGPRHQQGRSQPDPPRRLQDRITHGNNGVGAVAFYGRHDGSGAAFPRSQGQELAARMTRDVNGSTDTGTNLNGPSFTSTAQQAYAFHASQLHQVLPENQRPLFPVTVPSRYAVFANEQAREPIRMINQVPTNRPVVVNTSEDTSPKRPINPYRGKDPIKLRVQNVRLRAVLAGKPYPQQRKKSGEEKPVLRMSLSRTTK